MATHTEGISVMHYGVTVEKMRTWYRITITRDGENFFQGKGQPYTKTEPIQFQIVANKKTWYTAVPKPVRMQILRSFGGLEKGKSYHCTMRGQYIPWRDNPRMVRRVIQEKRFPTGGLVPIGEIMRSLQKKGAIPKF